LELNLSKELEVAIKAAKEAGKILRNEFGKVAAVTLKEDESFQTEADRLSEEKIISIIKTNFPDHSICAEESGLRQKHSKYLWLIDPLDGTTNFVTKIPFFSISITLVKNGIPLLGVVYDPTHEELFTAEVGKRASLNGLPIEVSETNNLLESMIGYSRYSSAKGRFVDTYPEVERATRTPKILGSTSLHFCYVANSRLDAAITFSQKPWDITAGSLIVEEAGGKVTDLKGKSWKIETKNVLASNGKIHDELIKILNSAK
jgi:myo-inositol-1(or 4)-monophosphatase